MGNPVITSYGTETDRPLTAVTIVALGQAITSLFDGDRIFSLIGEADGGAAGKAYFVRNEREVDLVLRGGALRDSANAAFSASPDRSRRPAGGIVVNIRPGTPARKDFLGNGAPITLTAGAGSTATSLVLAAVSGLTGPIPVGTVLSFASGAKVVKTAAPITNNAGTQTVAITTISGALIAASDTASYVEAVFILETKRVRDRANQTTYNLSGSAALGYTLSIKDNDTGDSISVSNLGKGLQLRYVGAAAGAKTVTITTVGGVKRLQTAIAGNSAENLDIPLPAGTTIRSLLSTLANFPAYQALIGRDANLDASLLDPVSAVDISAGYAVLMAINGDIALYFSSGSPASLVTYTAGPSAGTLVSPVAGYFTGATSSNPTNTDWAAGVNALREYSFSTISAITDDETVLAGIRTALAARADPSQARWTQFFQGGLMSDLPADSSSAAVSAYIATITTKIASINDPRVQYVASTLTINDPNTGIPRTAKTYEVAAMLAGLAAALGPNISLTYKTLVGSAPFPDYDVSGLNLSNRAVGIGATILETSGLTGPVRVVLDRTTYVGEPNRIYESGQGMRTADAIGRSIKGIEEAYIPGAPGLTETLTDYRRALDELHKSFQARNWITPGINTLGQKVDAYDLEIRPTQFEGRYVRTLSTVNIVLELLVGEHNLTPQVVEIETTT
jgi:hypothetical protein